MFRIPVLSCICFNSGDVNLSQAPFNQDVNSHLYPNMRQMTSASLRSQSSSQTVPLSPLRIISTRPPLGNSPSTSSTHKSNVMQKWSENETVCIKYTTKQYCYIYMCIKELYIVSLHLNTVPNLLYNKQIHLESWQGGSAPPMFTEDLAVVS